MGSGNKLQKPKKGSWRLRDRERKRDKENVPGGMGWGKAWACSVERASLILIFLVTVPKLGPQAILIFFLKNILKLQLTYNIILVSGAQYRD